MVSSFARHVSRARPPLQAAILHPPTVRNTSARSLTSPSLGPVQPFSLVSFFKNYLLCHNNWSLEKRCGILESRIFLQKPFFSEMVLKLYGKLEQERDFPVPVYPVSVILSVVFGDPPVRTVTVFTTSLVLSIQVLPNVHLTFNSSRLAGPTHWFRLLFACCCRDLPSDIQECVCPDRCHLFVFLPLFLSVFLFGHQLPPLVPRAPVQPFAFLV